ncbi:helix-turn-helix transcriptional regulator [Rahnella sp. PAMC 25559]|uniref:helix-turn-helix transcriptional regulator n=1 Tax=Rahnella sp. PAMC 25559 TaxID=3423225 RepID=UPI003D66DD64
MTHILTGITGYDLVSCISVDIKLERVAQIFFVLMFGTEGARKSLFIRTGLTPLTCCEKRVSSLLSKGLNQHDISRLTGINAKTVSSHLRSSMTKFKVKTLLEYRVKLSHINTLHCFNLISLHDLYQVSTNSKLKISVKSVYKSLFSYLPK